MHNNKPTMMQYTIKIKGIHAATAKRFDDVLQKVVKEAPLEKAG
jgi:hypothetical protein